MTTPGDQGADRLRATNPPATRRRLHAIPLMEWPLVTLAATAAAVATSQALAPDPNEVAITLWKISFAFLAWASVVVGVLLHRSFATQTIARLVLAPAVILVGLTALAAGVSANIEHQTAQTADRSSADGTDHLSLSAWLLPWNDDPVATASTGCPPRAAAADPTTSTPRRTAETIPGGPGCWSDIPTAVGTSGATDRPWLVLFTSPVALAWVLLRRVPSIRHSSRQRRIAGIGAFITVAAMLDIAFLSATSFSAQGAGVTAAIIGVGGAAVTAMTWRSKSDMVSPLKWVQRLAVTGAIWLGAAAAAMRAMSEVPTKVNGPGVATLLFVYPLAAIVVTVHDFLIVGGRSAIRTVLAGRNSPSQLETRLRRIFDDPGLRLAFQSLDGRGWIDVESRPLDLSDLPAHRIHRVGEARIGVQGMPERTAAIVWHRDGPREAASATIVIELASVALERAQMQARLREEHDLIDLGRGTIRAVDIARRSLERDLHDGAQQMLLAALAEVARIRATTDDPTLLNRVEAAHSAIQAARQWISDLSRGIYPEVLTAHGIGAAVDEMIGRYPHRVVRRIVDERFPIEIESTAYFVISEALTNAWKHAGPTTASVTVTRERDRLLIDVTDDGIGGATIEPDSGLGLLEQRVRLLRGDLRMTSDDSGTRISVYLPLSDADIGLDAEKDVVVDLRDPPPNAQSAMQEELQ